MTRHIAKSICIVAVTLLVAVAVLYIWIVLTSTVIRSQTSAEAANLSDAEVATLTQKAIEAHDSKAAARLYWYYRFTKKDFGEAGKWEWAVLTPPYAPDSTTNGSP